MDIGHDLWVGSKCVSRGVYNYGGRHALALGGRALEYGVGAPVALVSEHGLKFAWQGVKGLGALGASAINHVYPNANLGLPTWRRHNWGAPGVARPGWMWQHDPRNWPAVPVPPKYVRPRDRRETADDYDRTKAYKSTRPHSLEWHMRHAEAMQKEVLQEAERLLDWVLTPPLRINAAGNYFNAAGVPILDGGGNPIPRNNPAGGINPPPHDAIVNCPDLYLSLTHPNNAGIRNAARRSVLETAEWLVQLNDARQTEDLQWRISLKNAEKIQHETTRMHAIEKGIESLNKFMKDAGLLKAIFNLVEVVVE